MTTVALAMLPMFMMPVWVALIAPRVEHVTILGYVEPVGSAVYACFLVGQRPGLWAVVGGALIYAAGVLVILFGAAGGETSLAELAEAEPICAGPVPPGDEGEATYGDVEGQMSAAGRSRSAAAGYAMVSASYIIIGLSGTLVTWATAPESVLLALRYAIAVVAVLVVLGRPRRLRCLRQRDLWPRLVLMGFFDAVALLFYFYAVREAGVAIGTVFLFSQPVWIAILAPHVLGSRTEPIVYVSIVIALAGLGIILAPALSGSLHVSALALVAGLLSGWAYAGFALVVKDLTKRMDSAAMVLSECVMDCLFLLPLALWQVLSAGYTLTQRDLLVAVILGLVCTALAYSLWMEGVRWIRMQHSAVLGFLSPVAAPLFAWVLIGQAISVYTAVGGALVLTAGVLVVIRGEQDVETEPPV